MHELLLIIMILKPCGSGSPDGLHSYIQ